MNSYSAFDGDIVRPLGFVTLHAAYAEQEICELLQLLCDRADLPEKWFRQPVGWKLKRVVEQLDRVQAELIPDLITAVQDARRLFDQRNDLIHGLLFSGGRLVSLNPGAQEQQVTPDQVAELADALFNCKDRLNVYRQKQLVPALAEVPGGA
jgi:hypothetical protein